MNNVTLGKLIWVLIYGGLLAVVLGLVMQKTDAALGWPLAITGMLVAALGAVLVFVRARRKEPA
jgi:membrane protein DedA with SNARE-associated domain